jgi:hypothetical protein
LNFLNLPDTLDLSPATNLFQFGGSPLLLLLEEGDEIVASLHTKEQGNESSLQLSP